MCVCFTIFICGDDYDDNHKSSMALSSFQISQSPIGLLLKTRRCRHSDAFVLAPPTGPTLVPDREGRPLDRARRRPLHMVKRNWFRQGAVPGSQPSDGPLRGRCERARFRLARGKAQLLSRRYAFQQVDRHVGLRHLNFQLTAQLSQFMVRGW